MAPKYSRPLLDTHIKIPQQIAVLGVDNGEPLDESYEPPLSSILPNHEKLGGGGGARIGAADLRPGAQDGGTVSGTSTQDRRKGVGGSLDRPTSRRYSRSAAVQPCVNGATKTAPPNPSNGRNTDNTRT